MLEGIGPVRISYVSESPALLFFFFSGCDLCCKTKGNVELVHFETICTYKLIERDMTEKKDKVQERGISPVHLGSLGSSRTVFISDIHLVTL